MGKSPISEDLWKKAEEIFPLKGSKGVLELFRENGISSAGSTVRSHMQTAGINPPVKVAAPKPTPSAPVYLDDAAIKAAVRRETELESLKRERDTWRRKYQEVLKGGSFEMDFASLLLEGSKSFPTPALPSDIRRKIKGRETVKESAVLLLTDLHVGEEVSYEAMHGSNKYDVSVFMARMEELYRRIISICFDSLTGYEFDELVIFGLGDLINGMFGAMHDELLVTQKAEFTEILYGTTFVIAQFIWHLEKYFPKIRTVWVPGNHGRMSRKPWAKSPSMNFDCIIPQMVSGLFLNHPNVSFDIPDSFFALTNIKGQKFLAIHGHQVKGWASIPWYGINKTTSNLTDLIDSRAASSLLNSAIPVEGSPELVQVELRDLNALRVNHVVMGHFHTEAVFDRVDGEVIAGPCFPAGQMVTVLGGARKPIEGIKVGDVVLSHAGKWRNVIETFKTYHNRPLVGLRRGSAGTDILCTETHPIRAIKGSDVSHLIPDRGSWRRTFGILEPRWIEAENLSVGDYVAISKPTTNESSSYAGDPDWWRFVGLWLTEGHVTDNVVALTFHEKEVEFDEFSKRVMSRFGTPTTNLRPTSHSRRVRMTSQTLSEELVRICGKYADGKRLAPEVLSTLSQKDLYQILIGWLQGDGHVNFNNAKGGRIVSGTSVSVDLINQMQAISVACGFNPTTFQLAAGGPRKKTSYSLGFGGLDAERLAADLGTPYVDSKSSDAGNTIWFDGVPYRKLSHVWREDFDGYVYNFEVEQDHSYTVSGVSVHNCMKGADEFTLSAGFRPARAGQTLFGVHERNGITHRWRIDLQDAYEPAGDLLWWQKGRSLGETAGSLRA